MYIFARFPHSKCLGVGECDMTSHNIGYFLSLNQRLSKTSPQVFVTFWSSAKKVEDCLPSSCGLWCNHPNAFAMHLGYCAVQLENQWFSAWTVLWNSNGRTQVSCWLNIAKIVSCKVRGISNLSFLKQNRCFAYLKVNE